MTRDVKVAVDLAAPVIVAALVNGIDSVAVINAVNELARFESNT